MGLFFVGEGGLESIKLVVVDSCKEFRTVVRLPVWEKVSTIKLCRIKFFIRALAGSRGSSKKIECHKGELRIPKRRTNAMTARGVIPLEANRDQSRALPN